MLWDLVVGFFVLTFGFIYKIYCFLKKAAKWMSTPFSWTWEKIRDFFEDHLTVSGRLDDRFWAFGGFREFLLFCVILIFTVVNGAVHLSGQQAANYWMDLLYSTTLGSFFEVVQKGMVATPATMVAVAFSGFLFAACFDTLEDARLYVKIPCFVLYFIMSANLALLMTDVFNIAGDWLYTTGMNLMDDTSGSNWEQFGRLLLALPMVYMLLLLAFITLSEYLECVIFGLAGMLVLYLLSWLLGMLLNAVGAAESIYTVIEQIALWGVVFGLEAARKPLIDLLEDSL